MDLTREIKKIDLHAHSHFAGGPERVRDGTWPTPETVRRIYDNLNIEWGVQMSCGAPEHMHDPITSRDSEAICKAYPETFPHWFCALDPRMAWNDVSRVPNYSYYIDFFRERGARGAGEIQANIMIDDPRAMGMFSHCEKKDFPVTVHIGPFGKRWGLADEVGLGHLENVLKSFPNLTLIAHAAAFWSEISADVTDKTREDNSPGPVVRGGRIPRLLRKYPNLICDISAASGYNALSRDLEFTYEFIDEFYERIAFATDVSDATRDAKTDKNASLLSNLLAEGYRSGNISATAYRAICRDNALRILKL